MGKMMTMAAGAFLAGLTFCASAQDFQKAPPEPEGMVSLFNGKDLSGWDGDPRLWSVKDGVIRGETTKTLRTRPNTFLVYTNSRPRDFELRLTFRLNSPNNSGIQYRSRFVKSGNPQNKWRLGGYQYEVRNTHILPSVSGFIYDEAGRGKRLCLVGEKGSWGEDGKKHTERKDLITQEEYSKLFHLDGWNDAVIIVKGRHHLHYLNGRLVMDFTDSKKKAAYEGYLGLQLHAGVPLKVEFKNIRIKNL